MIDLTSTFPRLSPLLVIAQLEAGAAMYQETAEAWSREGIASCAKLNERAALVCLETVDALRQLHADEGADLGIGGAS